MPVNKVHKKTDVLELQNFLNGVVVGAAFPIDGFYGLVGKTLKFLSPAVVTVTFIAGTGTDPNKLSLAEIRSKVRGTAGLAAVGVFAQNGRIAFIEDTPASGISFDSTGTANLIIGISAQQNTVAKFYAPPDSGVVPRWTWSNSVNENNHLVLTYE